MRVGRLVALGLVLAIGCASCSGSSPESSASPNSASVELKNLAFSPARVHVAPGGFVTWADSEPVEHTVTAGTPIAPEATFDHVLHEGETFRFTFADQGSVAYFCRRHPTNMQGTVVVS